MRKLTSVEKKAAIAVLGMAAAVAGTGVKLLKRRAVYFAQKAAATFRLEEWPENLEKVPEEPAADAAENAEKED